MSVFAQGAKEATIKPTEPSIIRVLVWSSSLKSSLIPNNIEADFEAKNPGYDVIFETAEFDNLDKQVILSHATGKDYDIIQANHSSVSQFVSGGVLAPLDAYLKNTTIDLSSYQKAALEVGRVNGKTYAIPYDPDCRILAYNARLLKELGFNPPQTTDEMLAIARAGYEKGYYAMAGQLSKTMFSIYDLGGFMLSYGAKVYDQKNGKYVATLNTPEALSYMKWAIEMYRYMPKDTNIDDTLARSMFAQGKVLMMWWTPSQIKSVIPQFKNRDDLAFSKMPKGPTGISGSAMGGYMFSIGSGAPNKTGAWKFMEYVNTPENQAKIARGLPADIKSFNYAPYNIPEYDMFREQFETSSYPVPLTSVFPRVAEVWSRWYSQALLGVISAEEALLKGQAEVQSVLDTIN
jgi:ABC-type glycerol-3-phosphate transport system substrate-binding protein